MWPLVSIRDQVRNLRGEKASFALAAGLQGLSEEHGLSALEVREVCTRRPFKITKAIQHFLIQQLLALRLHCVCAFTTLQHELLANKGVQLHKSSVRKVWQKHSNRKSKSKRKRGGGRGRGVRIRVRVRLRVRVRVS